MKKFMIALVVTLTALFVCVQAHGKTNYSAIWNNMSKGEKAARVVGILEGACYGGEELTKALLDSPQLTNFKGEILVRAYPFYNQKCEDLKDKDLVVNLLLMLDALYQNRDLESIPIADILFDERVWKYARDME